MAPEELIAVWNLGSVRIQPVHAGHINLTFRVETASGAYALQRLHPVFDPAIHHDIDVVTRALEAAGLVTPRLVPAGERLWVVDDDGGVWRLMTWIEGDMLLRADSPGRCREAGRLLGRFHRVLWDSPCEFQAARVGVHDTERHLALLGQTLKDETTHPAHDRVAALAEEIFAAAGELTLPGDLPGRVVHGDPKISNVLFDPAGRAVCLVDLDTLNRTPIALELGDAFRSWCHPGGEDTEGTFELEYFEAGLTGWAEEIGDLPTVEERAAIAPTVEVIATGLAARFLRDALEESYFNWDRARYPSATEHNLTRARSQLALAASVRGQLPDLEAIVGEAWGSG